MRAGRIMVSCGWLQHIAITALLAGARVTRPYSPVTSIADTMQGYVDLIVRLVGHHHSTTIITNTMITCRACLW